MTTICCIYIYIHIYICVFVHFDWLNLQRMSAFPVPFLMCISHAPPQPCAKARFRLWYQNSSLPCADRAPRRRFHKMCSPAFRMHIILPSMTAIQGAGRTTQAQHSRIDSSKTIQAIIDDRQSANVCTNACAAFLSILFDGIEECRPSVNAYANDFAAKL